MADFCVAMCWRCYGRPFSAVGQEHRAPRRSNKGRIMKQHKQRQKERTPMRVTSLGEHGEPEPQGSPTTVEVKQPCAKLILVLLLLPGAVERTLPAAAGAKVSILLLFPGAGLTP